MNYILEAKPTITMPLAAKNPVIGELLSNYTYGTKWNVRYEADSDCITMGDYQAAEVRDAEYVINVTDGGVYIKGRDASATMRGFVSFLEKIKYCDADETFYLEEEQTLDAPLMNFRAVHLCVFPETGLEFLKKTVRACAIAKYTHIVFEFWGMLKFDCLKELSWPFAHSKDEIRAIVREANALGVEIIPMFNHIGHAPSCREINGKHVVLDQNPKYEYMYDCYGWVWNFAREDVSELLRKIRAELIEVCGKGEYFHLGCDEVYTFGHQEDKAKEMAEYLNKIAKELKEQGRRAIIWHDMMLPKEEYTDDYFANSDKNVSEILMNSLDKNILIADWQYSVHNGTWRSSKAFRDNGFEVVCCPWDKEQNIDEAVQTVTENELFGIIHTTWHTLYRGFREMVYAGAVSYGLKDQHPDDVLRFYCASVVRKVTPSGGKYEKCGWSPIMLGPGLD